MRREWEKAEPNMLGEVNATIRSLHGGGPSRRAVHHSDAGDVSFRQITNLYVANVLVAQYCINF